MKDYPEEWRVSIASKKGSKGKKQVEARTSKKSSSLETNTIEETDWSKELGGSATVRNPR
jgi:hypothetical protein